MTLTLRLTLVLGVMLTLAFALLTLAHYRAYRQAIRAALDEGLALRAGALERQLSAPGSVSYEFDPEEVFFQVLTEEGRILLHSPGAEHYQVPLLTFDRPYDAQVGQVPVRLLVRSRHLEDGQSVRLVVGESLQLVNQSLARSVAGLLVTSLAGLVLVLAATATVLGRGLRPLKRVASVTEQILDTNDFSRRVTVKSHDRDVVGQVSQLVNRLLARVEGLLESQRRLLADTSHELRNPLTIIQTDLDMLAHELPSGLRSEVASEVKSEVERMARLLDGLLALSWTEQKLPLPREPVRLDVLAEELVERNRRAHPDREIHYQGVSPLYLVGDRDRLLQAATNLLANALRYTEGRIWVSVARAGREALLEVADEGPGIPADQHKAIFERFVRLDKVHKRGTGLGLPIVRAIAEAHGGRVEVESPARGVLFRVRLPLEGPEPNS